MSNCQIPNTDVCKRDQHYDINSHLSSLPVGGVLGYELTGMSKPKIKN